MFAFVVCIRHPDTAKDYAAVTRLFERAAIAALNQTRSDVCVIAVANRHNAVQVSDDRLELIDIDMPAPPNTGYEWASADKGAKRLLGAQRALAMGARHVMMLDADDLVANDLAATIGALCDGKDGLASCIIEKGYVLDMERVRFQRKYGLHRFCGSTVVFARDALEAHFNLDASLDENSLRSANADRQPLVTYLLGDHVLPPSFLRQHGHKVKSCPTFGVSWVVNNGQNLVGVAEHPPGLPCTATLARRFMLPETSIADRAATLRERAEEQLNAWRSLLGARAGLSHQPIPDIGDTPSKV